MTTIAQLQAAGIPVTAAANGGPVETKTVVQNVDQLRSLLDVGLDQQGRQAHFDALFNGVATPLNRASKCAWRPCWSRPTSSSERSWSTFCTTVLVSTGPPLAAAVTGMPAAWSWAIVVMVLPLP